MCPAVGSLDISAPLGLLFGCIVTGGVTSVCVQVCACVKVYPNYNADIIHTWHLTSTPRSALELDCKPVSKKIRKAHIGVTLETEYIKEGVAK